MLNFTFGTFALDETNDFHPGPWRELHGAERTLTILRSAGTRGVKVLSATFEGKIMELQGFLKYDNAEDMVLGVQAFLTAMLKEGQPLIVENSEGEFVYDGCYLTNPEDVFEIRKYDFQSHIPVRLVFLCPKGFAKETVRTDATVNNITSLPYSGSITIAGDTNPEPVIEITLEDVSTIDSIYFINTTTNMQIGVEGLTMVDGDIITIDIAKKEVRLNNTPISFDGVFPDFIPGLNQYQLSAAGGNNLLIEQDDYNSEETVYGANKLGWKFTAPSTFSASQLALLIKKVASIVETLYDDFSGTLSKWTTSGGGPGEIFIESGSFRLKSEPGESTLSGIQNANLSSAGDGVRFQISVQQGGNNGNADAGYVEFTDDTDYIRVRSSLDSSNQMNSIVSTAFYGSLNVSISGNGELKIIQVGADIQVYWNGVLQATIANKTLKVNSKVKYVVTAGSNAPNHMALDNVYRILNANQNGTITVRIETDSAGNPSGTLVTNGSFTIPASEVGTTFSEILKSYATEPSLTNATVYHTVISQAGGDINNYYVFKKQNTDVHANANLETYNGTSWTQLTTQDLYIKIWSTKPTSFIIDLAIKYFKSYFNVG
jgi:hypothetical protein